MLKSGKFVVKKTKLCQQRLRKAIPALNVLDVLKK